ncbi:MAG: amino acid adenylation domain-containing protein [Legionellales bacterium]|nr:amino acid adenylation domain-containing protein [Legionellales bacterium]
MKTSTTIPILFEEKVEQMPEAIAIIFGNVSITYAELNTKVNQLAHYLIEKGVTTESHVALSMERSINVLITILAILKAGGAYVPLDSSHPKERLLLELKDNNTPLLIITSNVQKKFIDYAGSCILIDKVINEINKQPSNNPDSVITPQNLAYVIYTSGSTGVPKGVLIEHKSVINYSFWFAEYCDCQLQQYIDFSSSYIFDMALTTSIVPLLIGLTIVICSNDIKENTKHYFDYLKNNRINTIKITPSYFKLLLYELNNNFITLPDLKTIILGGENLSTADCISWLTLYPKHILFNEYGPTEATVAVSQYKVCYENCSNLGVNIPIGKIGPYMSAYILDENLHQVPDGATGELYIGGICLARGYLNQLDLTQKQFITAPVGKENNERLYKTGDLCLRLPNGVFEYLGRIGSEVKIRGYRVDLMEIEQYLMKHPAIQAALVISRKDHRQEEQLIAYYLLKNVSIVLSESELRQYHKKYFPHYMIPSAFVLLTAFPLTANGKLDHAELPMPKHLTNEYYLAPSSALEKKLTSIWSDELGISRIGLNDNFFELGGNSLSAERILSEIRNKLETDIELHDFYVYSSIEKLCTLINSSKNISENSKHLRIPLRTKDNNLAYFPLSDFQFLLWMSDTFAPKTKKINIMSRKRMQGRLDVAALTYAFEAVFKYHEVLFYRLLKFRPLQCLQKKQPFSVIIEDITKLTQQEKQLTLEASMEQLTKHYPWDKNTPLLIAKLFYLENEICELQICMPHIISDEVSLDILFTDLSQFYLFYHKRSVTLQRKESKPFKDYILNEQHYFQQYLDRDIIFWKNYLKDTNLFTFSAAHVVKIPKSFEFSYSTYLDVPESGLDNLHQFCKRHQVSIMDGLCAVLALALSHCCNHGNNKFPPFVINIVKSTRESPYNDTIGCFLRQEPVKIDLDSEVTLTSLSKQIHQSRIETSLYQQCSSLVKFACIGTFKKQHGIKNSLISLLTYFYTKIARISAWNSKIFHLCERLSSFKQANNFLININVSSYFLEKKKEENDDTLFGLKTESIKLVQNDLLSIESVLEVSFIRSERQNTPYIVISANLTPTFRKQLAEQIIQTMIRVC